MTLAIAGSPGKAKVDQIKRLLGVATEKAEQLQGQTDHVYSLFLSERTKWVDAMVSVYPTPITKQEVNSWLQRLSTKKWPNYNETQRVYSQCRLLRRIVKNECRYSELDFDEGGSNYRRDLALVSANSSHIRTARSDYSLVQVDPETDVDILIRWFMKNLVFSINHFSPSEDPLRLAIAFDKCSRSSGRCDFFEEAVERAREFYFDQDFVFF